MIQPVFVTIDKVASTEADVLILGENGTGKELVARALHRQSKRADEVFISVDMGAVVETLFESELFGHVKGAFTDAREDRAGRFELASGGTLFLDEIGSLSLAMQSKLLNVLVSRKITRVGSHAAREIDIRLICATNMPIHDMVSRGEFRQDLLYRVNTVEIRLPPLRERIGDVPLLAAHFLGVYSRKYKKSVTGIGPAAMKKLERYHWPGNIRELRHTLERAVILSDASVLQPADSEKIRDVCAALETIEKRSKGLIAFIEKYRELTRIPQPQFQIVRVGDLMERVKSLVQDQLAQKSVAFQTRVEPHSLEITADPALIEQVVINLCKNALEAMGAREKAHIDLAAETDGHGNPVIKVIDNGKGIPEEVAERIFIPFFTTKPGGSGIGLSLSRQIMRQHKGALSVGCTPGGKTVFTLRF